jgi:hypothetical protein
MIGLVATLWGKSFTAKAPVKCGGIVAEFRDGRKVVLEPKVAFISGLRSHGKKI